MYKESIIWDQLRSGDESALKKIYDAYFEVLINYGLRLSPHYELVEDSVQELFIDIWNLKSGISPTDNVKNYLICSFRRKLFKNLKQRTKLSDVSLIESATTGDPDFLNQLIQSEDDNSTQFKLTKALELLSARQKEAIFLKYVEGQDYDAICETMELKYQSVRNLISTAVARLRENIVSFVIFFILVEYIKHFSNFVN